MLFFLSEQFDSFNLFRYLTTRAGGALGLSLLISALFGQHIITWLKSKQRGGQPIRDDIPDGHMEKQGTPTMGGVLILLAIAISVLVFADLSNAYVWIVLAVTGAFGAIGFCDDYLKVTNNHHTGLRRRTRLGLGALIALLLSVWIMALSPDPLAGKLTLPFFKSLMIDLAIFFPIFSAFVIVGAANAVNLTDGLDGLAIVPIMIAAGSFGLIAYLVGRIDYSQYLFLNHIPGSGELSVFCAALIGAGLGFLWFNAPPAKVFMGDTGSLSAGGALGAIAVITKHEIVLFIVGGLFVVETVSVIIQVFWYRRTGQRIFLMAPIHHHFEKKGLREETIVIRAWIIAIVLALAGLATLKLR